MITFHKLHQQIVDTLILRPIALQENERQKSDCLANLAIKLSDFKMDLIKWQLNFRSCNFDIYMLFTGREVRMGKNCARGLEYGPRP